ncbi:PREDICTED: uncharacterized protein LOC105359968 [Ceratosolen solmsi marchali]|uniref:Uncharacterized protein LOC105359968 n=1 Tax=Ceratosolen solmsi marchali TaxID=326594 RepID=A0AAJ6YCK2_9HYME|nr:PREDICTED: uncharacterized protein LOC105359968 [Ceratosolen solmsi marchali]
MYLHRLIKHLLFIVLILVGCATAGLLSYGKDGLCDDLHNHHAHHHKLSVANSFMHFHGPVEGPVYEVKVPYVDPRHYLPHDEHNKLTHNQEHDDYVMDYIAHPKYEFSYSIEDHETGDFHSQKESRDGSNVSGEYSMMEPGGNVRVVSYKADQDGFRAVVHTSVKKGHSHNTFPTWNYNEQIYHSQASSPKLEKTHTLKTYSDESKNIHQLQHEKYRSEVSVNGEMSSY